MLLELVIQLSYMLGTAIVAWSMLNLERHLGIDMDYSGIFLGILAKYFSNCFIF